MTKINGSKQKWIEKGYEYFALYGPDNLSIKKISKDIGLARTTFYHYFGDLDIFTDELLDKHWEILQQFCVIASKKCKKLMPDLYCLYEQHPIPLKFHKQLFLNRHILNFNCLYEKAHIYYSNAFVLKLFSEQFNLNQTNETLINIWTTVADSWYSKLDVNDLSAKKTQLLAEVILNSVMKFTPSNSYNKQ